MAIEIFFLELSENRKISTERNDSVILKLLFLSLQ